jgi:cyclopropane fatty-acyl-phospholipid synthase-like methyltransferase
VTCAHAARQVVSIGMFEHVGDHYFGTFFEFVERCAACAANAC